MAKHHHNPEAEKPQKTVSESVDSLIKRKKSEKESGVSESTNAKMQGTKEDIDVIVGMEKPSETISEKAGEKGERKGSGGFKAIKKDDDDDAQSVAATIKQYSFPSDAIMIKKIRTAINAQIKEEWQKAAKLENGLTNGKADSYNKTISKIRALKAILFSLFDSAADFLKEIYIKYFMPNGKRRELKDVI